MRTFLSLLLILLIPLLGLHVKPCLSETKFSAYQAEIGSPILPIQSGTWVATDGLGRQLPTAFKTGPFRKNKYVGIFYFLWHGEHDSKAIYDIAKLTKRNPAKPNYGPIGSFHWWSEPEAGYYKASDPWVIRRNLQMLTMAGVDVLFFDVTNASTYLPTINKLCEIAITMRHQGIPVPYFCFLTHTKGPETINALYEQLYKPKKYEELWFRWQGKPLILGKENEVTDATLKNFFTWRYSWAWTNAKAEPHHWQWLDNTPQNYGWDKDPNVPEEIPVSVAGHPIFNIGKSAQMLRKTAAATNAPKVDQGLYFQEQWDRALTVTPQFIFVTGWNEWIAQRFVANKNNETKFLGEDLLAGQTYFVDLYDQEYNRDIEPMKGGYSDNYYYQLVANIRRYKGIDKAERPTPAKTIQIDGEFAEWTTVKPIYTDASGDVIHRDYLSAGDQLRYKNATGRNDIVESRLTYDQKNLYAYVRTRNALTKPDNKSWMLLFIDTDNSIKTGWMGYDYLINQQVENGKCSISKWTKKAYVAIGSGAIKYKNNYLELSLPLSMLAMKQNSINLNFHWADNIQRLYSIDDFLLNGDSAPDRRFMYNYNVN